MKSGISIALCTYNGSKKIEPTLLSIFNQKEIDVEKFELLIIDNASTDNTAIICESIIKKNNFLGNYKIIAEPKAGAVNARLRAVKEASFKWLLLCDDDNELDENYLQIGLSVLENNSYIGALGGKGIAGFEGEKPLWFDKCYSSYAVGEQNHIVGKLLQFNAALYGAGTFFNNEALLKIFNTGFNAIMIGPNQKNLTRGEDTEWCYLLKLYGYEIWYESSLAFIHHFNKERLSWEYYLRLKKGIAAGAGLLFSYHFLLQNKKRNLVAYFVKYFFQTIKLMLLYFKLFLFNKTKKVKSKESELGFIIVKYKLKSFLYNYYKSYKNFRIIQRIIENK